MSPHAETEEGMRRERRIVGRRQVRCMVLVDDGESGAVSSLKGDRRDGMCVDTVFENEG